MTPIHYASTRENQRVMHDKHAPSIIILVSASSSHNLGNMHLILPGLLITVPLVNKHPHQKTSGKTPNARQHKTTQDKARQDNTGKTPSLERKTQNIGRISADRTTKALYCLQYHISSKSSALSTNLLILSKHGPKI